MGAPAWTVTITFTPTGAFRVHADAQLTACLDQLIGRGDTRKHPSDPDVPEVGAALAAARALTDLAEQLQQLAADRMQEWDHSDVILLPVVGRAGTLVPRDSAVRSEH